MRPASNAVVGLLLGLALGCATEQQTPIADSEIPTPAPGMMLDILLVLDNEASMCHEQTLLSGAATPW